MLPRLIDNTGYIFPIYLLYRPELIETGMRFLEAAGRGRSFTDDAECELALSGLISYVRQNMLTPIHRMLDEDLIAECAWGQAVCLVAMEDRGLAPLACARGSEPGGVPEHYWAVLPLMVQNEQRYYLFDPTYLQFCEAYRDHALMHGRLFPQAQDLANKGFIRLTPEVAQSYLAMFMDGGDHYATPEAAMHYMLHCPHEEAMDRADIRTVLTLRALQNKKGYAPS